MSSAVQHPTETHPTETHPTETHMTKALIAKAGTTNAGVTKARMARNGEVARIGAVPAARPPRLRITARGRAVLVAIVAAPLVIVAMIMALNGGGAVATENAGAPLQTVTVIYGESLWELANELAPGADPREFIADVVGLNSLDSAEVRAGQQLQIPSEYAH